MTVGEASTRADDCYERIKGDITSGLYPPGTVLSEATLTGTYQMSRTPVREALNRIERDGLLRRVVRGFQVPQLDLDEIVDIYNVRIALEVTAVTSACERASANDLAALRSVFNRAFHSEERDEKIRLNRQWHLMCLAAGRNRTAMTLLDRTITQLSVYDTDRLEIHEDLRLTDDEHLAVMEAIERRETDAAAAALRAHLERVRDVRLTAWRTELLFRHETP